MTRLASWLVLAALLLPACKRPASSHGFRVITGERSAPFDGPVAVYGVGQGHPEPYAEVAIVRVSSSRKPADELVAMLKHQARQVGANAIIEMRINNGREHSSAAGVAVRYGAAVP